MAIELDTSTNYDARIRVVGVGGGGGNAVRTMISRGLEGVEFIVANTDHQALMANPAKHKIQLGKNITRGLGAGANPEKGRQAVEESEGDVRDSLQGADMVFVTAGMGGGTGTGAAPVIARVGREAGALVVGIVTKPFAYESKKRAAIAVQGIRELKENVDALIVIPNERILQIVDRNVSFVDALAMVDTVLYNATKGIANIISGVGYVNVDFADVRTVMANMGDALMGIGTGRGEHRAMDAATSALNSPILEGMSIKGAQGLLVNVTGGVNMTMFEVSEAVTLIERSAGDDVNLIHGVVVDEKMDDEISITVVATGFNRPDAVTARTDKSVVINVPQASAKHSHPLIVTVNDDEGEEDDLRTVFSEPVTPLAKKPAPSPDYFESKQQQSERHPVQVPTGPEQLHDYDAPAYVRRSRAAQQTSQNVRPAEPRVTGGAIPISEQGSRSSVSSGNLDSKMRSGTSFLRKILD